MPFPSWNKVFSKQYPAKRATDAQLRELISTVSSPLSDGEISAIVAEQRNPFPKSDPMHDSYRPFDPCKWRLPSHPLPDSYLDFLRWSNGGSFFNCERSFDPFFNTTEIREYLLAYHIPQYMPEALPFAFDGGGSFYLFDMRQPPTNGEYPILFALLVIGA
jgi:SMI1 / KNR4 family (SUKH-1)